MISQITSEQQALIPVYRNKWRSLLLSTQPLNQEKATTTVKQFYRTLGKKDPQVNFFASQKQVVLSFLSSHPDEIALNLGAPLLRLPMSYELLGQLSQQINADLWDKLKLELDLTQEIALLLELTTHFFNQLSRELSEAQLRQIWTVWHQLSQQQINALWQQQQAFIRQQLFQIPGGQFLVELGESLWQWGDSIATQLSQQPITQELQKIIEDLSLPWLELAESLELLYNWFNTTVEASSVALIDYCVTVLGCNVNDTHWQALQSLVKNCNTVVMFENSCLVCDRPIKLSLDNQNRLHAEGEPAIEYADGSKFYAYGGVNLPARYGTIHPHGWQARWILNEANAELRRVLIQGIGYGRIIQELQAVELDSWREYTLLEMAAEIDFEPVHLLKMTCPSTGHIHVLRVPPDIFSAREAIRWANWGIDPEEFSVST